MINSVNFNHLPIQDLVVSGLIIFIMSTIIANIYDPLLGITYAFGNILTLTFLSWLYKETWSDPKKTFSSAFFRVKTDLSSQW